MRGLSDATLERLRTLGDAPALEGTRYRLVTELGRGGMGIVYQVHDRELARDVAMKVVSDLGTGPDAGERLVREARALAHLEHPGIVPVHDAGLLPDGRVYYTMTLVRGERLDAHLERGLGYGDALRLFARLCEVVAFAHARGVIHRDLKPQNVMLGPFGQVLVLDWGLAKAVSGALSANNDRTSVRQPGAPARGAAARGSDVTEPLEPNTAEGTAVGTPGFMAPEQARGDVSSLDERTDIYALGAILGRLVEATGKPAERPLGAIIARATALDPAARYPTVAALSADIARYQDGEPVSAYRENLLERAGRVLRRHRMAVALVAAYLIMRITVLLLTGARD